MLMPLDFTVSKLLPRVSSTQNTIKSVPNTHIVENNQKHPYRSSTLDRIGNVFRIKKDIKLIEVTHIVDPMARI